MVRTILKGLYDMHVHVGPSVASREMDTGDMLLEAQKAGYAGFLVKDHYASTMMGAQMVEKHLGDGSCKVYGAIALNNSVGLFNLKAVETAYHMGARMVYFPTVSTKKHIDDHRGTHFAGAGSEGVPEIPVTYVDEYGRMLREAVEVLKYMAEHDIALGTGHGSLWEVDHLVKTATDIGVKRILVNHPHYNVGASIEDMLSWVKLGAFIEVNVCVFKGGSGLGTVDDEVACEIIRRCGAENVILDSDMGQKGNGSPVEAMYSFICLLNERFGITESEINTMGKINPKKLFGL